MIKQLIVATVLAFNASTMAYANDNDVIATQAMANGNAEGQSVAEYCYDTHQNSTVADYVTCLNLEHTELHIQHEYIIIMQRREIEKLEYSLQLSNGFKDTL